MARKHATADERGHMTLGNPYASPYNMRLHNARRENQPTSRALGTSAYARQFYHEGRRQAVFCWRMFAPDFDMFVDWTYEQRSMLFRERPAEYERGYYSFVDSLRTAEIARMRKVGTYPPAHITVESWDTVGNV